MDIDISKLRDELDELSFLKSKRERLEHEVKAAEAQISALLSDYERERDDVLRLEEKSFSAFLLKLAGKYEDRLDSEQREEIAAKIEYDRAKTRIAALEAELGDVKARMLGLAGTEKRYAAELERRRVLQRDELSGKNAEEFARLEDERSEISSQIAEIKEAQAAANHALSIAGRAEEALRSARGWAAYDVVGGSGIFSHMAKYAHIDEAEGLFASLDSCMKSLRTELADISGLALSTSELRVISDSQRSFDLWFDNMFTDFSVLRQLEDNAKQLESLSRGIGRVITALGGKLKERERKLAANKRAEEEFLLSL